jgi:integrase
MMATTFDVRVWTVGTYKGVRGNTYYVRWSVAGERFKQYFKTRALADSFRADLVKAARTGEAFNTADGRPVSAARVEHVVPWFRFACDYVDMKWSTAAANYRRSIAEALAGVTLAMVSDSATRRPAGDLLRRAMLGWAFNSRQRQTTDVPSDIAKALAWLDMSSMPVTALGNPRVCRAVLDATARTADGRAAAATTARRHRAVLSNAIRYAVELGLLTDDPTKAVAWRAERIAHAVDRRSVVNPRQAHELLTALSYVGGKDRFRGERLRGFFALMYFAAARPAEALYVREADCLLPAAGWGRVTLHETRPAAGKAWTDSGDVHDHRGLKHRAANDTREVPLCPQLVAILRAHLCRFGTAEDGRLFRSPNGGVVGGSTYSRVWEHARLLALPDAASSPLAARPYDLRHAAVSTWLNGGVPPTQVAQWAGHSVAVLLQVYAKCLDGQEAAALRRVEAALAGADVGTH